MKRKKGEPEKPKHGGKRANSGRKHSPDPKLGITIYIVTSEITLLGGTDAVKELAVKAIHEAAAGNGKEQTV